MLFGHPKHQTGVVFIIYSLACDLISQLHSYLYLFASGLLASVCNVELMFC